MLNDRFLPYWMFFFFNDTATTEIYTLSLHDALPILAMNPATHVHPVVAERAVSRSGQTSRRMPENPTRSPARSEEHTSELQSRQYLVCRLLLEKKKNT